MLGTDIGRTTLTGKKMSNPGLIFRTFKQSNKEKLEEQAEEYADEVAKSGSPVSYTEA